MGELFTGIFIGAIGSLVAVGISKVFTFFVKRESQRLMNRFWKLTNNRVVIIHPVYQAGDGINLEECFCRIEDEIVIQLFIALFKELKIDYTVQDHNKDIPDNSDIVLVCSPKGNKQSQKFVDIYKDKLPYIMEKDNDGKFFFLDQHTGTKYFSPLDTNNKKIDYGIVAKIIDYNSSRNIYMFWGIHGAGTLAAAKFSMICNKIKKIYLDCNCESFALLIKAPYLNRREIGEPEQVTVPIKINM